MAGCCLVIAYTGNSRVARVAAHAVQYGQLYSCCCTLYLPTSILVQCADWMSAHFRWSYPVESLEGGLSFCRRSHPSAFGKLAWREYGSLLEEFQRHPTTASANQKRAGWAGDSDSGTGAQFVTSG